MRTFLRVGWLPILCLALACPPALAQVDVAPSKVAVFRLEPRGMELSEDQVVALSVYLADVFHEKSRSQTVSWIEILRALPPGQDPKGCVDRDCQGPLETQLGVDFGLHAIAVPLGKACLLTGVIYPAAGGQSSRTASVRSGCSGDELVAGLEALAVRLVATGPLLPPDARARARAAFADLAAEEAAKGGPPPGAEPPPPALEPPPPRAGAAASRRRAAAPRCRAAAPRCRADGGGARRALDDG